MNSLAEDKENIRANKRFLKSSRDSCVRCGKTPRSKPHTSRSKPQSPQTISLLKPDKPRKCRTRCKHKKELAKYTEVSVTSVDTSDGEASSLVGDDPAPGSLSSSTRSVRSVAREEKAKVEIEKLTKLNAQLSAQLASYESGNGLGFDDSRDRKLSNNELESELDNTLTPNGGPANISVGQLEEEDLSKHHTPHAKVPNIRFTTPTPKLESRSRKRSHPNPTPLDNEVSEAVTVTPVSRDSGYQSKREQWKGSANISKELLSELEEENRELRDELKTYVTTKHQMMLLEKDLRSCREDCERYRLEVARLEEVEAKLGQVEEFYYQEKKTFRTTIEDTLLTLEEYREDKQELEAVLKELKDKLKEKEAREQQTKDELQELKTLSANKIEKLKLELETGQSEVKMLNSKIATMEENKAFLEGQVKALEKNAQEKYMKMSEADTRSKEQEVIIKKLEKELKALELEKEKASELATQVESMSSKIEKHENSNNDLLKKLQGVEEQNNALKTRLTEVIDSHAKSEESAKSKEQDVAKISAELETTRRELTAENKKLEEERNTLKENNRTMELEKIDLQSQIQRLAAEVDNIEHAFFRGWSEQGDDETDEKTVKFEDEQKHVKQTRADKIIQTIKNDRQKLKAKLVRAIQDNKTLQEQLKEKENILAEKEDNFHNESAKLAKRLRDALNEADEGNVQCRVFERTAKNLSAQVEELSIVNRSLELENYHLKKLNETISGNSVTGTPLPHNPSPSPGPGSALPASRYGASH